MNTDISLLFRFKAAIETLATGKGDIRSRLKDIVPTLSCIQENDLPPEFRKKWSWMWKKLTEREPEWKQDNTADASLRKIRNSTGQKMVKLIFNIWQYLEKM